MVDAECSGDTPTARQNAQAILEMTHRIADWWRLDGALEKVRVIWTSMAGHREDESRGPADYELTGQALRILNASQKARRVTSGNNSGNDRDPDHESRSKLLWWILGIYAALTGAGVVFVGQAIYDQNAQIAALTAKVDFLLAERAPRYRGSNNGRPD